MSILIWIPCKKLNIAEPCKKLNLEPPNCEIFKTRNADLQLQSLSFGWQKIKKKKNIDGCKALFLSRKHNKRKYSC